MIDFAAARRMMVDGQVRTSDVTDPRIIAAMLEVPRERFVPERSAALAYLDLDLPVTEERRGARRLLKPMVLAKLIQAADIGRDARVLDVACGTGYSSAVLARLARSVVALEDDPALAAHARATLALARLRQCRGGDGSAARRLAGRERLTTSSCSTVPPKSRPAACCDSCGRAGGWSGWREPAPASKAMLYVSTGGQPSARPIFDAAAPQLPAFAAPAVFVF